MRIYLDNCSLNRPYDDQSQLKIHLESEAKLWVQDEILRGRFELAWSYILEIENNQNPYLERKESIGTWQSLAVIDIEASEELLNQAKIIQSTGIKELDSLHIASAIMTNCVVFLTTDKGIIKKKDKINKIRIMNPVDFILEEIE